MIIALGTLLSIEITGGDLKLSSGYGRDQATLRDRFRIIVRTILL
jgi:hypothetical protein